MTRRIIIDISGPEFLDWLRSKYGDVPRLARVRVPDNEQNKLTDVGTVQDLEQERHQPFIEVEYPVS